MAQHPQPPARPPANPPQHQPPTQPQAPRPAARGPNEPGQPLVPPLPPAQSSPPRQPAPGPAPYPDEPCDQRYREGEDRGMPAALTPEQRTALVTEPRPPQKFKRPLPQPGDNDYVQGQPVNEEEARRVEQEDEERFARGQASAQEAIRRRQDVRTDDQASDRQHPGSPAPKHPDDGEPLHKPGHHRGDDKDK